MTDELMKINNITPLINVSWNLNKNKHYTNEQYKHLIEIFT